MSMPHPIPAHINESGRWLSEDLLKSAGRQLQFSIDSHQKALWAYLSQVSASNVTRSLLDDILALMSYVEHAENDAFRYFVLSSQDRDVFCLGGDLEFFRECIETGDRAALTDYGYKAVAAVYSCLRGCHQASVRTVAVVRGEAQGGGFEAALSCHLVVAEKGSYFGFPEPLFGLFPGMGGRALIRQRTDDDVARRVCSSTSRYSAEFLHEIGVIDYIADRGQGVAAAREIMASRSFDSQFELRAQQLALISHDELIESVERWVTTAMELSPRQLRAMKYICNAQRRCASR